MIVLTAPEPDGDGIENPIGGVDPIFGWGDAGDRIMTVFGVFWGLLILLAIAFLAFNLMKMAHARGSHAGQYADGRDGAMWAAIGLGLLIGLPIIVGFLIWLFG